MEKDREGGKFGASFGLVVTKGENPGDLGR